MLIFSISINAALNRYFRGHINWQAMDQVLQSYLGIAAHANQHAFACTLQNAFLARPNLISTRFNLGQLN